MVGEEGRAQVTRDTGRRRKRQTQTTPGFFLPLASMDSRTLTQKTISGSDASSNSIIILYSISLFDLTGTLLSYSSKKSSRANLIVLS